MQGLHAEVGPGRGGEIEFAVSALVEQIIAQALFSAGADEEVGVGLSGGVQMVGQALFGDVLGAQALGHHAAHGAHKLGAAAVVEGQVEHHVRIGRRAAQAVAQGRTGGQGQGLHVAQDVQADALALHAGHFLAQKFQQQGEQGRDFGLGPRPVLAGKGVQGQVADAQTAAFGHDGAHGLGTGTVPHLARQTAGLGPAAVAVHDDGQDDRPGKHDRAEKNTARCPWGWPGCGKRPGAAGPLPEGGH